MKGGNFSFKSRVGKGIRGFGLRGRASPCKQFLSTRRARELTREYETFIIITNEKIREAARRIFVSIESTFKLIFIRSI